MNKLLLGQESRGHSFTQQQDHNDGIVLERELHCSQERHWKREGPYLSKEEPVGDAQLLVGTQEHIRLLLKTLYLGFIQSGCPIGIAWRFLT